MFEFLLSTGIVILTIGGGIYCLQSIHREKDLNTFDYQRVTRLTPLELTLGKLFGAPSLLYFIALCLLPITLVGVPIGSPKHFDDIVGLRNLAFGLNRLARFRALDFLACGARRRRRCHRVFSVAASDESCHRWRS